MIVLIPAYEPTATLPRLVRELRASVPAPGILVIDDGSGSDYCHIFDAAQAEGAEVIGYRVNRGKGHALKTGFRHINRRYRGHDVVTADSDGQHHVRDIFRVADAAASDRRTMVLGVRRFTGGVPLRSRFGNAVSSAMFRWAAGYPIRDTQTGLRGFPAALLGWLEGIEGDRFEYEVNVLLNARPAAIRICEIPIETIYLDQNAGSHFRPLADSLRVTLPLLRFIGSSLLAFAVDFVMVQVLQALTHSLLVAVPGARLISASVNFAVNRKMVFGAQRRGSFQSQLLRYAALAIALLTASYLLLSALTNIGIPLALAKLLSDGALYAVSYVAQRRFVFRRTPKAHEPAAKRPKADQGAVRRPAVHEPKTGGPKVLDRT